MDHSTHHPEERSVEETERFLLPREAAYPQARPWWQRVAWKRIALFAATLLLFLLAINLMKEGARDLAPLVRDRFAVSEATNSLGFGWLFSYLIMSGSPVAAVALTFFDAGIVDKLGSFAMITGSRLGASFIVLFIGFIYVLRGRSRVNSLSMGLLTLVVTGTVHIYGLVVDEILDEARRGEFDIIVLGAHQVSGWRRLLAADPVHEIALRSELPLLIV